jgi:hypothetical protein
VRRSVARLLVLAAIALPFALRGVAPLFVPAPRPIADQSVEPSSSVAGEPSPQPIAIGA